MVFIENDEILIKVLPQEIEKDNLAKKFVKRVS